MSLPVSLPLPAVSLLIDYLTPGGKVYKTREVVEAAYDVVGFVLSQVLADKAPVALMANGQPAPAKGLLDSIPWSMIFVILQQLLDDLKKSKN